MGGGKPLSDLCNVAAGLNAAGKARGRARARKMGKARGPHDEERGGAYTPSREVSRSLKSSETHHTADSATSV